MTSGEAGGGHYSSCCHSPVPYLLGGLAAMLGLIGFALLLLLACSHRKLPSSSARAEGGVRGDGVEGDDEGKQQEAAPGARYEEKIVVIMAGDEKPTYLATPSSSRASSSLRDHSPEERKDQDVHV